jgi:hypothetical protein
VPNDGRMPVYTDMTDLMRRADDAAKAMLWATEVDRSAVAHVRTWHKIPVAYQVPARQKLAVFLTSLKDPIENGYPAGQLARRDTHSESL